MNFPPYYFAFCYGLTLPAIAKFCIGLNKLHPLLALLGFVVFFFVPVIWSCAGFENLQKFRKSVKTFIPTREELDRFFFPCWKRMFLLFVGAALAGIALNALGIRV